MSKGEEFTRTIVSDLILEREEPFSRSYYLLRLKSHPLSRALSYALVVDAFYGGHVVLNHAGKIGLDTKLISMVLLLKSIVAILGFNNGFTKINLNSDKARLCHQNNGCVLDHFWPVWTRFHKPSSQVHRYAVFHWVWFRTPYLDGETKSRPKGSGRRPDPLDLLFVLEVLASEDQGDRQRVMDFRHVSGRIPLVL